MLCYNCAFFCNNSKCSLKSISISITKVRNNSECPFNLFKYSILSSMATGHICSCNNVVAPFLTVVS